MLELVDKDYKVATINMFKNFLKRGNAYQEKTIQRTTQDQAEHRKKSLKQKIELTDLTADQTT